MGSSKLTITLLIALVLLFFIYESKGSSPFSFGSHIDGAKVDHQKVNLSVYYESLSKSSAIFIVKDLMKIFNNDLINIVNLHLVPWANSQINKTNNSISCQNGPEECEINSLEGCALNIWHDLNIQYGLIYCVEFLAIEGRSKKWSNCFDQLGLRNESIVNCITKGNGTELGQKYIEETAKLNPPHSFVPWVLVNNEPIGKDYANFTQYVCKAYKGDAAPPICNVHL